MRGLIVSEFVTLDGVMEAPGGEPSHPHTGWVGDRFIEEIGAYKQQETLDAESLLVGRVTYESFAESWPENEGEFADKMNAMPKHVVSTTLHDPTWANTTVLRDVAEVDALKAGDGGPILLAGSCTLLHALLARGVVDELRLMVFPVMLGSGLRWFHESPEMTPMALTDSKTFSNGVVVHTYEPRPA